MDTYKEASRKGRVQFMLAVALFVNVGFISDYLNVLFPISTTGLQALEAMELRYFISAIIGTGILAALLCLVIVAALSSRKYMQWPTPPMEVPWRFRHRQVNKPESILLWASMLFLVLVAQALAIWYSWYSWRELLVFMSSVTS